MQIDVEPASLIGEDSRFEGRFLVKGSMRIDGRFEGGALMVDQLAVGAKGRVRTNITASSVVVEGVVIGNIEDGLPWTPMAAFGYWLAAWVIFTRSPAEERLRLDSPVVSSKWVWLMRSAVALRFICATKAARPPG